MERKVAEFVGWVFWVIIIVDMLVLPLAVVCFDTPDSPGTSVAAGAWWTFLAGLIGLVATRIWVQLIELNKKFPDPR